MEFCKHFQQLPNGRRITVGAFYANGTMNFGVSVCKPGEPFCKKLGRARSIGKAKSKNQVHTSSVVPSSEREKLGAYFHNLAEQIMNMKDQEINLRDKIALEIG